ncbi:MAG: site-specific integrase [Actinobacteria bacterium]|nr:site-specific integrase [Actinomycetota bacterium]
MDDEQDAGGKGRFFGYPDARLAGAWTLADVCAFLQVSERTGRTLMRAPGAPPPLRLGSGRCARWNPYQVVAPVRLHRPAAGKSSWRVTFPDGRGGTTENTRRTREEAEDLARARAAELAVSDGPAGLAHRPVRDLLDYYMQDWADHKRWSYGYRQERARAVRWLPAWFLDLPVAAWRTRHCDDVLAGVASAGYPLGTGEYWRTGTLLSGLVTAAQRGDYLAVTSDRPSPMRNVAYRQDEARARGQARGSLAEPQERYTHVRPVRPAEIPGAGDVEAYAEAAGRLCGFRWQVHGRLLAGSGIREAESLRLTVDDVRRDPDSPFVHVWRQLVEIRADLSPTGKTLLTEEPPKGGNPRYAWYRPDLVPLLDLLVEEVAALPGPLPVGERPLFYGAGGGLVRPNNWRRRVFNKAAVDLAWEQIPKGRAVPATGRQKLFWLWPPHSFRHHAATWMLKDLGMPSPLVADYLGHVDSAFTERMYMDRTRTDFGRANAAFDAWAAAAH